MLHSYTFSNFRSFRGQAHVSFELTDKDVVNGWAQESTISNERLSTAIAILGSNASGKTSLIQPLAFLNWFVANSFRTTPDAGLLVPPHFLAKDFPTEFEVVTDSWEPEIVLRYRLSIDSANVVKESLEKRLRRGQWRVVFDRRRTADGRYAVAQNEFGLDPTQAEAVRPNVSLISWAAQFGVEYASKLATLNFTTNVTSGGKTWQLNDNVLNWSSELFAKNDEIQTRMRHLLAKWDLGLSDVIVSEADLLTQGGETKKHWYATGLHVDRDSKIHSLPFVQESSGTKAAFSLLALVLPVLATGGLVAFDEIDGELHPHILETLLELFSNKTDNPFGAQIIFTSHSTEVLRLLQKSQIYLVEKDGLESEAWRLDAMDGVRVEDNRVAKYLAGAYGAIPRL
jgi:uncharacterized protein